MIFWFLGLWPHLNLVSALAGGGIFVGFGLFMLMLWVPDFDGDPYARERIQMGFYFIAGGLILFLLGAVASGALLAGMAAYVLWTFTKSLRILIGDGNRP